MVRRGERKKKKTNEAGFAALKVLVMEKATLKMKSEIHEKVLTYLS